MELDDLKSSWQSLHDTLAKQHSLNLRLLREQKLDRAQRGLRPLQWGMALQMGLGVLLAGWSASLWSSHVHTPHLLVTGLVMHAYGLGLILFGARVQVLIARLDFGAPVLEIQRRLAELRRFYGRGYAWLGLPWWVLWMLVLEMAFMSFFRADLYANLSAAVVVSNLAVGALGWAATLALGAWARRHPGIGPRFLAVIEGKSLTRAQAQLDELAEFEAE
jgi:hypothetical protein